MVGVKTVYAQQLSSSENTDRNCHPERSEGSECNVKR